VEREARSASAGSTCVVTRAGKYEAINVVMKPDAMPAMITSGDKCASGGWMGIRKRFTVSPTLDNATAASAERDQPRHVEAVLERPQRAHQPARAPLGGLDHGSPLDHLLDARLHLFDRLALLHDDVDSVHCVAAREGDLRRVDEHYDHLPAERGGGPVVLEQSAHEEGRDTVGRGERERVTHLQAARQSQLARDQDGRGIVCERQRILDDLVIALLRERQEKRVTQKVDPEDQQRSTLPVGAARDHLEHGRGVVHAVYLGDLAGKRARDTRLAAGHSQVGLACNAVHHVFERGDQTVVGRQHRREHADA
jgi:hypothetical protein